jgi:F-type H+-transporting ATPase subunit b
LSPTLLFLAAEGEEEHNPLIPAVGEIVVGSIAFVILLFVLMKYAFPAFDRVYNARRDAIEGGIARAEAAQAEAAAALDQYRAQLAEARGEAGTIREDARAEAQRIVEGLREQARSEADRIVARGEEQLAVQRAQIVRELRAEVGTLAVTLAERIVGQTLSDDTRVQATVDSFLAELEQDQGAGAARSAAVGPAS